MPIVRTFLLLRFVFDSSSGAPQRASLVWFTNLQPLVGFLLLQPSVGHLSFIHDIQPSVEKERWRRRNRFVNQTMTSKREVKGDVRRLVFNQSCSSNTNRLVSFMVWITNLLSSPRARRKGEEEETDSWTRPWLLRSQRRRQAVGL